MLPRELIVTDAEAEALAAGFIGEESARCQRPNSRFLARTRPRFGTTILWAFSNYIGASVPLSARFARTFPECTCVPFAANGLQLLLFGENAGVKFHDFAHVGQEIRETVVARIRVILMLHSL